MIVILTITFCLFVEKVGFSATYEHKHSLTILRSFIKKRHCFFIFLKIELSNEEAPGHKHEIEMKEQINKQLIDSPTHEEGPPENFSPFLVLAALSIHSVIRIFENI